MEEIFRDDFKSYPQALKCHGTERQWYVLWTGVSGKERKEWFYYKSSAKKHYHDVVRAGFVASTNAIATNGH